MIAKIERPDKVRGLIFFNANRLRSALYMKLGNPSQPASKATAATIRFLELQHNCSILFFPETFPLNCQMSINVDVLQFRCQVFFWIIYDSGVLVVFWVSFHLGFGPNSAIFFIKLLLFPHCLSAISSFSSVHFFLQSEISSDKGTGYPEEIING